MFSENIKFVRFSGNNRREADMEGGNIKKYNNKIIIGANRKLNYFLTRRKLLVPLSTDNGLNEAEEQIIKYVARIIKILK